MRGCGSVKVSFALLCYAGCAWQKALRYYWRSLVECGSTITLEHSQRVASLYLRYGKRQQLCCWTRLFSFEGVPACALTMKALVRHDMWRSAISLWRWDSNGSLCDSLVDELMMESMWEQSLRVVRHLLEVKNGNCNVTNSVDNFVVIPRETAEGSVVPLNDTERLSFDTAFVPSGDRRVSGGLSRFINNFYSERSQWQHAVWLLVQLSESGASSRIREELLEVAAARSAYHGRRFEDVLNWAVQCECSRSSCSLQRTLLRSATAVSRWEVAFAGLERLVEHRLEEVPVVTLHDLCEKFMRDYFEGGDEDVLRVFCTVVSKCWNLFCREMKHKIMTFFEVHSLDVGCLWACLLDSGASCRMKQVRSSCEGESAFDSARIDRTTSFLLSGGHWKSALCLISRLCDVKASNERDKLIISAARASMESWWTALMFFV